MVLSDTEILKALHAGDIIIDPFDIECLGSNSYDVHLSKFMATYDVHMLDASRPNKISYFEIPASGFILQPNTLYLGSTLEYTESHKHLPYLDGKSSTGRLGICIHLTAGRGDVGFCNFWTLELTVPQPVRVYAGMPIGQLTYHCIFGEVAVPYDKKPNAKFTERDPRPKESMLWKNKFRSAPEDFRGLPANKNYLQQPAQKSLFIG